MHLRLKSQEAAQFICSNPQKTQEIITISCTARLLNQLRVTRHALVFENRTTLLDLDHVAAMKLVGFIVRMIFLRDAYDLAVQRVFDLTLDQDGDRLVHLVADHSTGQGTLQLESISCSCISSFLVHPSACHHSLNAAISRRTLRISLVLVICCVATCMRRPNCALVKDSQLLVQISCGLGFEFSWPSCLRPYLSNYKSCGQRQLGRSQAKCLTRQGFIHTIHFVQHLAG